MKTLITAAALLFCITTYSQVKHDFGAFIGASTMQTDFGTSEVSQSSFANFGSYVELDYYYHLYNAFRDIRSPMFKGLYSHLLLNASISYTYIGLDYYHEKDGDPIFTGELPGTEALTGYTNLLTAGAAIEYHLFNLQQYYGGRSRFKISPFIGFGMQYNGANVQTNSRINYDIVYGDGNGIITPDEIPVPDSDINDYGLNYNLNPIAESNLSNFSNYINKSTESGSSRQAQLLRYAGMNRPEWVNTVSFTVKGGTRIHITNNLEMVAQAYFQMFLSDDLDGLNMPWSQNQSMESIVNLSAGLVYHIR